MIGETDEAENVRRLEYNIRGWVYALDGFLFDVMVRSKT